MLLGLGLALASALAHAAWNTAAKHVSAGGVAALWAYTFAAWCVVTPAAAVVVVVRGPDLFDVQTAVLSAGSTLLHTAYAATLQRAYRSAQMSQVYPLSRGLAPALVAASALAFLGQTLSTAQVAGMLLMCIAVGLLLHEAAPEDTRSSSSDSVLWSLAIATIVAAYTLYDGWAVVAAEVDPLGYYVFGASLQLALLSLIAGRKLPEGIQQLRVHRRVIAVLAVLIPTSYLTGLYASQLVAISVVAALRSSSLIWAACAASMLLGERIGRVRAAAIAASALAMVAFAS